MLIKHLALFMEVSFCNSCLELLSTLAKFLLYASTFPFMIESPPKVAELPTCQKTWQAVAPPLRTTLRPTVVMRVDGIWKMKTASGSPWASRVRSPDVISSEDVDV